VSFDQSRRLFRVELPTNKSHSLTIKRENIVRVESAFFHLKGRQLQKLRDRVIKVGKAVVKNDALVRNSEFLQRPSKAKSCIQLRP